MHQLNGGSQVGSADGQAASTEAPAYEVEVEPGISAAPGAQAVARSRAPLVVAVLGYCGAMVSMMHTVALPLLPALTDELGVTVGDVSWVSTATLLAGAVANPLLGRLGDMYGKRRVMLVSLGALVAGSALAAVAGSLLQLVVGRTLQGLGISVIPLGISIARDELPEEKVTGGIALVSATLGIGGGLGLPLAGVLLEYFDWHSVFWASMVMAVVALVAAVLIVPESPVRSPGRFDALGGLWLSVVLVAVLLPLSKGPTWGWTSRLSLASFAVAALGGYGWLRYVQRHPEPVVDIGVMRRRPVLLANAAGLLLGFSMFTNFFGAVSLLQLPDTVDHGFGVAIAVAGWVMLPGALAMGVMSPVSARLTDAYGGRTSLLVGSIVVGAGFAVFTFLLGSLAAIGVGVALVNCGVGIAYGALPAVVMANVPVSETASANAVNALTRSGGASVGSAAVAAILASVTVTLDGEVFPALGAFRLMFLMAAAGAFAAAALAWFLPRHAERRPA